MPEFIRRILSEVKRPVSIRASSPKTRTKSYLGQGMNYIWVCDRITFGCGNEPRLYPSSKLSDIRYLQGKIARWMILVNCDLIRNIAIATPNQLLWWTSLQRLNYIWAYSRTSFNTRTESYWTKVKFYMIFTTHEFDKKHSPETNFPLPKTNAFAA